MEKKKKFDFLSKCLRLLKYLSKYNPYANMKYEEMLMRLKEGKKRGKDGIC